MDKIKDGFQILCTLAFFVWAVITAIQEGLAEFYLNQWQMFVTFWWKDLIIVVGFVLFRIWWDIPSRRRY